jgi:Actinobacteria/chloroflexi VLRF1 release factor
VSSTRTVLVPPVRVGRWFENFASRHGAASYVVTRGRLRACAQDGVSAEAALPFGSTYDGAAEPAALADAAVAPGRWGVLLVRKGGFAVATVAGDRIVESKVGQRHVQGRTKAGGQSQQRFARRRDNQARQAYEAAAAHAARVLTGALEALVCGGDHTAVDTVLDDPRLRRLSALRVDPWLAVPDPRRSVLEQAVLDGCSVAIAVTEPA